jgi:chlorite dismutase
MSSSADSAPVSSPSAFTLWAVFRRSAETPTDSDLTLPLERIAERGVTIRGFYDVSGLRADADLMIWMHGPVAEDLQWALRELRRNKQFSPLIPTWNAMGVHRDAEFNRSHVPGFLRGEHARDWLVVYPFDRSYDWYVLEEDDRRRMLADHGRKGAAFESVVANTVAAFALGDYEWILPMESDSLTDLVDMMRALRATEARLHVRGETPFFTGRRIEPHEIIEVIR